MSFTEAYPFDNTPVATETQWQNMARHWTGDGPVRNWENQLEVYGDSSGRQVKVRSGQAFVQGTYGRIATETILPIAANATANPRIDLVVIRRDLVTNTFVLGVAQGTPAVSPTVPPLLRSGGTWEVALAQVAVAAGATTISAGNVTDLRTFRGPWHMPWGVVDQPRGVTANQTGIGTTITDITGCSVTWVATANRWYRATFSARLDSNHGAIQTARLALRDQSNTETASTTVTLQANGTAGDSVTAPGVWVGTRSAGVQTLKLSALFTAGAGNAVLASGSEAAFLLVEDIGPSGAPT